MESPTIAPRPLRMFLNVVQHLPVPTFPAADQPTCNSCPDCDAERRSPLDSVRVQLLSNDPETQAGQPDCRRSAGDRTVFKVEMATRIAAGVPDRLDSCAPRDNLPHLERPSAGSSMPSKFVLCPGCAAPYCHHRCPTVVVEHAGA